MPNSRDSAGSVAVTSDLVRSRALPNRDEIQRRVEAALDAVNREYSNALLVPFTITLGDEWQGLVKGMTVALEADFTLRERLHPLCIATGIGVGPFATDLRERTALMDGPCFHRSREALERARHRKGSAAIVESADPLLDEPANSVLLLLHAIADGWSETQAASFRAYVAHGTEAAAAAALGVSQPTVHQSLDRSIAKPYIDARAGLFRFVAAYENAPDSMP